MKFGNRIIDLAQGDLDDILEYMAREFSIETASKFVDAFEERLDTISNFPKAFPIYTYDERFRRIVIGKYLMFYIVDEENNLNNIIRIIHPSRDIKEELRTSLGPSRFG